MTREEMRELLNYDRPFQETSSWRMHMRIALRQLLDETEWRDIETAPKDGREVELRGKYLVGHWMPGGYCIEDHPAIDQGWYFWNGCMFAKAPKPTHWRPLPAPPKEVGDA